MEKPGGRLSTSRVLNPNYDDSFTDLYKLGRKLGSGQFGTTYECWSLDKDKTPYAAKIIQKVKLITRQDIEDVRMEVAIMHHVAGHENIVTIQGAYEDVNNVYIVMELCTGGELYDNILERMERYGVPYSERDAAAVARSIMKVVDHCNSLGVIHRDLKPENFLLSSRSRDAVLKATDFGLSTFFRPDVGHERHCGSPMYMAPEVVRLRPSGSAHSLLTAHRRVKYGPEVDVWSAGVIFYAILCGFPPFYARSHSSADIFKSILKGNPSFSMHPWPTISDQAKDLIKWMLDLDPKKRPSPKDVLRHPWINEPGIAPDVPLDPIVATRLKQFAAMVKMKKVAMKVIAENLKEEEILGLKELFSAMDTDNSGTITIEELKAGLHRLGSKLTETEIESIMEQTDVDQNGQIDYREFVAATMHLSKVEKHENLRKAFAFFDTDHSNYISLDELHNACRNFNISKEEVEHMMSEVDQNHDGRIDFKEFENLMLRKAEGMGRRNANLFVPNELMIDE